VVLGNELLLSRMRTNVSCEVGRHQSGEIQIGGVDEISSVNLYCVIRDFLRLLPDILDVAGVESVDLAARDPWAGNYRHQGDEVNAQADNSNPQQRSNRRM